ncbi:hypothetical protein BX070DRAFT_230625 [Coemansia spiralis]|nr:hypothetical protein BX070DRAFT_230625 [Coemansia spiralis]
MNACTCLPMRLARMCSGSALLNNLYWSHILSNMGDGSTCTSATLLETFPERENLIFRRRKTEQNQPQNFKTQNKYKYVEYRE